MDKLKEFEEMMKLIKKYSGKKGCPVPVPEWEPDDETIYYDA